MVKRIRLDSGKRLRIETIARGNSPAIKITVEKSPDYKWMFTSFKTLYNFIAIYNNEQNKLTYKPLAQTPAATMKYLREYYPEFWECIVDRYRRNTYWIEYFK